MSDTKWLNMDSYTNRTISKQHFSELFVLFLQCDVYINVLQPCLGISVHLILDYFWFLNFLKKHFFETDFWDIYPSFIVLKCFIYIFHRFSTSFKISAICCWLFPFSILIVVNNSFSCIHCSIFKDVHGFSYNVPFHNSIALQIINKTLTKSPYKSL